MEGDVYQGLLIIYENVLEGGGMPLVQLLASCLARALGSGSIARRVGKLISLTTRYLATCADWIINHNFNMTSYDYS